MNDDDDELNDDDEYGLLLIIVSRKLAKSFTSQVTHGAGAYLLFLLCKEDKSL